MIYSTFFSFSGAFGAIAMTLHLNIHQTTSGKRERTKIWLSFEFFLFFLTLPRGIFYFSVTVIHISFILIKDVAESVSKRWMKSPGEMEMVCFVGFKSSTVVTGDGNCWNISLLHYCRVNFLFPFFFLTEELTWNGGGWRRKQSQSEVTK